MELIFKIVLCHLVGDYVLQNDFIAQSKGDNWYHLFVHCLLYTLPFYFCFGWSWKIVALFATHVDIDVLKARYKMIKYSTDQIFHYIVILLLFLVL